MRPCIVRHVLAAVAAVPRNDPGACFVFAPVDLVREAAGTVLSDQERAGIAAFACPRDRTRRAAAHTLKRLMLGRLLAAEADAIPCCGGGTQPPGVAGRSEIGVSLAHAGDWVAAGVGLDCAVGVDVEKEAPADIWPQLRPLLIREAATGTADLRDWCGLEARVKRAGGWLRLAACSDARLEALALEPGHAGAAAWDRDRPAQLVVVC